MKNQKSGRQKARRNPGKIRTGRRMLIAATAAVVLLCIAVAVCVKAGKNGKKGDAEVASALTGRETVQSPMAADGNEAMQEPENAESLPGAESVGENTAESGDGKRAEDAADSEEASAAVSDTAGDDAVKQEMPDENRGQASPVNTEAGGNNRESGTDSVQKTDESGGTSDRADREIMRDERDHSEGSEESSDENKPAEKSEDSAGEKNGEDTTENKNNREISMPYKIPGSDLVLLRLAGYDGTYLEDGTDSDVSNVATVLLQNTGTADVEYTSLLIGYDGGTLEFEASAIPQGASVIVQEKNKTDYNNQTWTSCKASSALLDSFEMSEDKVRVEDNEDGSLRITNRSGEDIGCVRIMYKLYMEDEDTYVGGITYMAKVDDLKAEESRTITPSHYDAGHSRVMMVKIYDEE